MSVLDSAEVGGYSRARDVITSRMPDLVKGIGMAVPGGNTPLSDQSKIFEHAMSAEAALIKATKDGIANPDRVKAGLNPSFANTYNTFLGSTPQAQQMSQWTEALNAQLTAALGKNFTLTSPLSSGFVPFDLLAPSRLIYPVYSPMRNKIQRVPGQGTSHRAKLITAISGSQTGQAVYNSAIGEFPNGQSISGNWPMQLPGSGSQSAVDVNIPYKFFGMSESLSWLAQFQGQGFEDISALANQVLLQETMLAEEYQILAGTGTALNAPTGVTVTAIAATSYSGSVPVTGYTTDVWAEVTALNFFGETIASSAASATAVANDVYDVQWNPVPGAFGYNVYVGTGGSAPARTAMWKANSQPVGGCIYTIQGALPTSGSNPPSADTGTGSSNQYEGMMSVLDGWAATNSVYPSGFSGGYSTKNTNAVINHEYVFTALEQMWSGNNGFRADPAEMICEGTDLARLSDEIIASGANNTAYRLFVQQDQAGQVTAGAAVSEFINPVTRSVLKLLVHPWLYQGNVFYMSYTLPMTWSNTPNVWENVMVQDYLSIAWPVIDLSFRYSLVYNGALVCYAPQYNGVQAGFNRTVKPYT